MASYKILVKRSAEKELRNISPPALRLIVKKIHTLSSHPRPQGVEMLKGEGRFLRIRQGDYRIIYEVNDERREVKVIKVGRRREVYNS